MNLFSRFYKNCLIIHLQLSVQNLAFTFGDNVYLHVWKLFYSLLGEGAIWTTITVCYSLNLVGFLFVFFFPFRAFVQDESLILYWQCQFCSFVLVIFQWYINLMHVSKGAGIILRICVFYVKRLDISAALKTVLMPKWFQVKCILFYGITYVYVICIVTYMGEQSILEVIQDPAKSTMLIFFNPLKICGI